MEYIVASSRISGSLIINGSGIASLSVFAHLTTVAGKDPVTLAGQAFDIIVTSLVWYFNVLCLPVRR
jgi:hypothetical protein